MAKISVIIPVYNTGEYLHKCIQSVLAQKLTDFELILVDDGSTDNSAQICDEYAKNDSRVNVIHKENEGVSVARNTGIKVAQGEFIGFIDSDDWVEPSMYQDLYELAQTHHADIVMCDAVTKYDDREDEPDTITQLPQDVLLKKQEISPELLRVMAGSVCRCLYCKELLDKLFFPIGIKLSEDRLFNLAAMGRVERIQYLKRGLYFRYIRKGSACNRYHGDIFEKNLQAMQIAKNYIEKYWSTEYIAPYIQSFIIGGAMNAIYEIASKGFSRKSRLGAIREITAHPALRDAFFICRPQGVREKLLEKKANIALLLVGIIFDLKNGR